MAEILKNGLQIALYLNLKYFFIKIEFLGLFLNFWYFWYFFNVEAMTYYRLIIKAIMLILQA